MFFDELGLYFLFPLVVAIGSMTAATLAKQNRFPAAMVGVSPVFVAVLLLTRDSVARLFVFVPAYAALCFAIVRLMEKACKRSGKAS